MSQTAPQLLSVLYNAALDAVFPPRCAGCQMWSKELFCPLCQPLLKPIEPPFCALCGHPFDPLAYSAPICAECQANRYHDAPTFKLLRSVYEFEEPVREAVHRLKYKDKIALAQPLAELLHNYLHQPPAQEISKPAPIPHEQLSLIVPVPLHPWRRYRRGYNQSTLLAKELGQLMQVPVQEVLRRTRHTIPQVELSAKKREENVRGAFVVDEAMINNLSPETAPVLLIDDVCTTGSTLRECAGVLQKAGVKEVYALTLARQL